MTPQERKVFEMALEALTYIYTETTADEDELIDQAITAIKEALAQPEQYPQIAINPEIVGYVAPPCTWVGLTNEDIWGAYMESPVELDCSTDELYALSRTVEAKLKDKNS